MTTIQDCLDAYDLKNQMRLLQEKKDEEEARKRNEENTLHAFQKIGLEPDKVEGSRAYFALDGQEYCFIVAAWKHGNYGFYRLLDEKCPNCDMQHATDEATLDIEGIGYSIRNPQERYHDCPKWHVVKSSDDDLPQPKNERELLMDAFDAYIHTFEQEPA